MINSNPYSTFLDGIPYIMEGQVVSAADPDQMGRCKIWVPALDGENFEATQLPWCDYASPFAGFTIDYPGGGVPVENLSHAAYGMWAVPKIGATVLVFCLNADPTSRFYFASTFRTHRNRSLPAGRNFDGHGEPGPWGDAGDGKGQLNPIQPAYDNLREQFQGDVEASEAVTRGAYERQVAQALNEKDGEEGYAKGAADPTYLDPQTVSLTTPGRHAIILQDEPSKARVRIKTAEGHQIILDDANERIYISTSRGKSWIEMDQDGRIHVFGSDSISIRTGKDMNFFADQDINFEAERHVNFKANTGNFKVDVAGDFHLKVVGTIFQSACDLFEMTSEKSIHATAAEKIELKAENILATASDSAHVNAEKTYITGKTEVHVKGEKAVLNGTANVHVKGTKALMEGSASAHVKGASTYVTADAALHLNGGGQLLETAGVIHLNGPSASRAEAAENGTDAELAIDALCPEKAEAPTVVPGHEPWPREPSVQERGPNWRD